MKTHDIPDSTASADDTHPEHVSELSKADLIVLMQDMREADITLDMEVIAACQKWGISPATS